VDGGDESVADGEADDGEWFAGDVDDGAGGTVDDGWVGERRQRGAALDDLPGNGWCAYERRGRARRGAPGVGPGHHRGGGDPEHDLGVEGGDQGFEVACP